MDTLYPFLASDVLQEIYLACDPYTQLSFACTSHDNREIQLTHATNCIWKLLDLDDVARRTISNIAQVPNHRYTIPKSTPIPRNLAIYLANHNNRKFSDKIWRYALSYCEQLRNTPCGLWNAHSHMTAIFTVLRRFGVFKPLGMHTKQFYVVPDDIRRDSYGMQLEGTIGLTYYLNNMCNSSKLTYSFGWEINIGSLRCLMPHALSYDMVYANMSMQYNNHDADTHAMSLSVGRFHHLFKSGGRLSHAVSYETISENAESVAYYYINAVPLDVAIDWITSTSPNPMNVTSVQICRVLMGKIYASADPHVATDAIKKLNLTADATNLVCAVEWLVNRHVRPCDTIIGGAIASAIVDEIIVEYPKMESAPSKSRHGAIDLCQYISALTKPWSDRRRRLGESLAAVILQRADDGYFSVAKNDIENGLDSIPAIYDHTVRTLQFRMTCFMRNGSFKNELLAIAPLAYNVLKAHVRGDYHTQHYISSKSPFADLTESKKWKMLGFSSVLEIGMPYDRLEQIMNRLVTHIILPTCVEQSTAAFKSLKRKRVRDAVATDEVKEPPEKKAKIDIADYFVRL